MSIQKINLSLYLGKAVPSPAPLAVAEALQSVQVTRSDEGPSVFQLNFNADRTAGTSMDYALLSSPLLKPTNRLAMTVTLNGVPRVLMDGFITHQELVHDRQFGATTLAVTGEDVGVVMDLYEFSLEYPAMPDAAIAAIVLAKYTLFGVIPEIIPTPSSLFPNPVEWVPQQNGTDRSYLQELAAPHGYVFYVKPGPEFLMNTAYWGPPIRIGTPASVLSVDVGPATNVESISFQYDALAPTLMHGMLQDPETELDVPIVTLASTRLPPFASEPALLVNQPFVRNQQYTDPRLGAIRGFDLAQSVTDKSTDKVVSATGKLNVLRYGDAIEAPGLINVRGAGFSYDGTYYVQSVTHHISRESYTQDFTLTREGMGSLITEVPT